MKPGEHKIIIALMEKSELSYSELKLITGLSGPSLSDYLKGLTGSAIIEKGEGKKGKYQIVKAYSRSKAFSCQEMAMKFITESVLKAGLKINQEKDQSKRLQLVDKFLTIHIEKAVPLMTEAVITYALNEYVGKHEIKYDSYSEKLREAVKEWFVPLIENLGLVAVLNFNYLLKADSKLQLTPECFKEDFDNWLKEVV